MARLGAGSVGMESGAQRTGRWIRRGIIFGCLMAGLALPPLVRAQAANLSGFVRDEQNGRVSDATVTAVHESTGVRRIVKTDTRGSFAFLALPPGEYRLEVIRQGFQPATRHGVYLEVDAEAQFDVVLSIEGVAESVSVTSDTPILGSRDGSVGTVVSRQFAEALPLNGRTFQGLLELATGVSRVSSGGYAVSGQRTDGNYFQVDGVSAQTGVGAATFAGAGVGQAVATTAAGGYSGLVSVDALQEFRVQTSSAAPEFGRGPGAQVSIVTRSGTNTLLGSFSDYVRHDSLDANNWFVNYLGLPNEELRQNHLGAVLGGPIIKSHLFYFGSYERLRVRQPRVVTGNVLSRAVRNAAAPALQPLVNVFPEPTGPDVGLVAEYSNTTADRLSGDAVSGRVDWSATRLQLFGRYNESPSSQETSRVSFVSLYEPKLRAATFGATHIAGARALSEVRFNYTESRGPLVYGAASWPGTQPFTANEFPRGLAPEDSLLLFSVGSASFGAGTNADNELRQFNVVASTSLLAGEHRFKVGVDYRRLIADYDYVPLQALAVFGTLAQIQLGQAQLLQLTQFDNTTAYYHNLSLYAQDEWRRGDRLSLTYGVRWDVNPAPTFTEGREPLAAVNFDDPSQLDFAPRGTRLWNTRHDNVAPRLGATYALDRNAATILGGAVGLYYDLGTQASGQLLAFNNFPVAYTENRALVTFPLTEQQATPSPRPELKAPYQNISTSLLNPALGTPRTLQWNVRVERRLSTAQTASVAYVGARGEHLISTDSYRTPNARFPNSVVRLLDDQASSRYRALQVQYRNRIAQRLETQVGYTLGSSTDNASRSAALQTPGTSSALDEGPSDFDVRHIFSGAVTWTPRFGISDGLRSTLANGWSLSALIRARSAAPLTLTTGRDVLSTGDSFATRPDVVEGVPMWIESDAVPGGRYLNRDAFTVPPTGRQGTLGRGALRGFAATQTDLSVRRAFEVTDRIRLHLMVDVFNVFNLVNFADPDVNLNSATFGYATRTYNVNNSPVSGDLSTLYQWGGPRSIQLGLKVQF
jgi:hypothetical protein